MCGRFTFRPHTRHGGVRLCDLTSVYMTVCGGAVGCGLCLWAVGCACGLWGEAEGAQSHSVAGRAIYNSPPPPAWGRG